MTDRLVPKGSASKITPSGARSSIQANSHTGEVAELPRVCAMFDKPYIARYARGERGMFRCLGTVKLEAGTTAGAGKGSAAGKPVTLKFAEISRDSEPERCAWCGVKGELIFCDNCGAWVCRSQVSQRDGKDYFRCRASCGSEGFLTTTTQGYEGHAGKPQSFAATLPEPKKNPALPDKTRAQLGPGSGLRRKP